jgi:MFS family permease
MDRPAHAATAATIVVVGLLALASAMGVGRFAFTPLLPLMQAHDGLSLGQGAWLATANYLGYAAGALACSVRPPAPHAAARAGLIAVAVSTLAMGVAEGYPAWLVLRFVAGVASACVLVGVSGWALAALGARGRAGWSGGVFSGVGIGIALAGVAGLVAGIEAVAPATVWLALAVVAFSIPPSKRADYLLPAYPAASILAAYGMIELARRVRVPVAAVAIAPLLMAAYLAHWELRRSRVVGGHGHVTSSLSRHCLTANRQPSPSGTITERSRGVLCNEWRNARIATAVSPVPRSTSPPASTLSASSSPPGRRMRTPCSRYAT